MCRAFALLIAIVMLLAFAGAAHIRDGMDDNIVVIVLPHESPILYDADSSDDSDYPDAIPVRLLRANGAEKPIHVLKAISGVVPSEPAQKLYLNVFAPSQQGLYHRQEVLRI